MSYRIPRYIRLFDLLSIIIIVILLSGCQLLVRRISQTSPISSLNGKLVVLGFRSAFAKVEEEGVIQSPFSESVFVSESISQDITHKMTRKLFSRLKDYAGYSEDILDARIFFKGKGKWMTMESLADLGLSDILDRTFSTE
jgi:hypothetical protein